MDCRVYRKGLTVLFAAMLSQLTVQAQTQQQWRDSLAVLNARIAQSSWNTDLHLRKAAVNMELGQWDYAADEYTLVLSHDDQNPAARFYRAYANSQLKRYDLALFDYDELLRVTPLHFEARLGHAYVQQKIGRRTEALDELNLMAEMFPDSALTYAVRAGVEQELHQTDLALYDWELAEQHDPLNAGYAQSHAELLLSLQRREEARRVLDEAVSRGIARGLLITMYRKTLE